MQISDPDLLRGYEAGAVDYVPVPVVPELLRAKVRVFAELYRKTRQLEQLNAELEQRVAERTAALEATAAELQQLNDELEQRIEERTREREAALAQLFEAQKLDTIGQLTGGVAHDFNNLLMVILGSLRLLEKRLPDDPRSRRLLDNALQGAERGAALTQRLLSFARRQELKLEPVDVVQLVSGMEELLKRALGPLVNIAAHFPVNLPRLRADAHQLELALLNLAINARDAMPLGGSLTLTAAPETVPGGGVPGLAEGNYLRLSMSDNGIGMDAEVLAKATEPFFTTKGLGSGTGLGLSMVHGLAAQSGGALRIMSEPGRGTTVELWLPQVENNRASLPVIGEPAGESAAAARSLLVLVVDDDALVGAGTAAMLEELGHLAVEVSSAPAALDVLRTGRNIDVVVTDHAMPVMTGAKLAEVIKAERPGLPVVLATGYADIKPEENAPWDYRLAKPFDLEDLASVLAQLDDRVPPSAKVVPLRVGS